MKKVLFVTVVLLFSAAAFNSAYAQKINNRIGPMLAFASGDVDETGLGVVAEFGMAPKVTIAPQFILYFPGNDQSFFELNGNVNYYFFAKDVFELYGLGGLNFARASAEDANGDTHSNNELGLNIGIGSNFQIGKTFVPFAELRFTLGDYDQFVFGLGVKFNLN
jgi:hypothetical protein